MASGFFATALREIRDDFQNYALEEFQRRAPVRSGNLRRSFRKRYKREVVSDAPYAAIVDKKTPYVDESVDAALNRVDDYNITVRGGGYAPSRARIAPSSDIFPRGRS